MTEQMLRVQTRMGPVGLREKRRGSVDLQVPGENGKQGKKLTIKSGWLSNLIEAAKEKDKGGEGETKTDDAGEKMYHKAIKQAMLIAARTIDINDGLEPAPTIDPNIDYPPEELETMLALQEKGNKIEEFKNIIEKLKVGKEQMSIAGHKKTRLKEVLEGEERPREFLVKYSKRGFCYQKRYRYFIIEDGTLVYYKNRLETAKQCDSGYALHEAKLFVETLIPGGNQIPEFETTGFNFDKRIKVEFKEREEQKKNPLYLYPKDKKQMENWKRSFSLARVLVSDNDRRTMRTAIGRSVNALLIKGWDSLFWYQREMKKTRALVQQMSMRLIKVDISRGWTKMKLLWVKDKNEMKRREEMQEFAARFLSERLARLGSQQETPASELRESVVSRIQERFRAFREEAIFDRRYPITPKHRSRMQQAMSGTVRDVALEALDCKDVLMLTVNEGETLQEVSVSLESFITQVATYSETNIEPVSRLISVSDNLQALVFAGKAGGSAKADMSNFVNLDRISQVVMNSAPQSSIQSIPGPNDEGVWCSVYGPRVGWGKRIEVTRNKDNRQITHLPVGAKDGFTVARAMGGDKTKKVIYAQFIVTQISACEWDLSDPKNKNAQAQDEPKETRLHVHILGYRFSSEASSDGKSFSIRDAKGLVPLAADDQGSSAILDQSPVVVEVVQYFVPKDVENAQPYAKQILVGSETLGNIFAVGVGGSKMQSYQGTKPATIKLASPNMAVGGTKGTNQFTGSLQLEIQAALQANDRERESRPISPEFYGAGIPASLYSSHRGAWYDNEVGLGRFRIDRVPNYVEIVLKEFRFPKTAQEDKEPFTYRIRAKVSGIMAVSIPMHRSKTAWQKVLGHFADPYFIDFDGTRLCLPLPPGCWGNAKYDPKSGKKAAMGNRPIVEIEVVKAAPFKTEGLTYDKVTVGMRAPAVPQDEVVYHAALTFDEVLLDEEMEVSVFLGEGAKTTKEVYISVDENTVDKVNSTMEAGEGVLNVEVTLRDRDAVRATGGKPGKERTLCVGDKALMEVEEELYYPASNQEMRMRFGKDYKEGQKDWPAFKKDKTSKEAGKKRGKELRDPAISSEYDFSMLGQQTPKVKFRPGVIPSHCQDIFPHKYALPYTEKEFHEQRFPGVWDKILDDITDNTPGKAQLHGGVPRKPVVTHLSHHVRTIPVTLLAVYPDGTCAVEIAPNFMESWRRQPKRRYNIPGEFVKPSEKGERSKLTTRSATPLEKGAPELKRAILRKVPTIILRAAHSSGFHIYDASFKSLDDYAKAEAPQTDFNPMGIVDRDRPMQPDAPSRSKSLDEIDMLHKSDSIILPAGPLPPDASPAACQYEWIMHVRSKNVNEMNQFVSMLRQCVRVEHYTAATRIEQALSRRPVVEDVARPMKMIGGQLEIVLVEARRLQAVGVQEAVASAKEHLEQITERVHNQANEVHLKGTTSGALASSTPKGTAITTFVNFRLWVDGKVMPLKGQNVQHSSPIESTSSPNWSLGNTAQGGFVFRTGHINPDKLGEAIIEFEVCQETLGTAETIGTIHLGVTNAPCLIDPENPFKNFWLPLTKEVSSSGPGKVYAKCKTGELHIMTRWVTAEQMAMGTQIPVQSELMKQLWPKINATRIKEPIYQLEPQYWHYNPNLVHEVDDGHELPSEHPPDFIQRTTIEMYNALKYMECLERRQIEFWQAFEKRLGDHGHMDFHYGDFRRTWMHRSDHAQLSHLTELIEGGIPSIYREQRWLEFTGATEHMYGDMDRSDPNLGQTPEDRQKKLKKAAEDGYRRFLNMGIPQTSEANSQLAEDCFHLAGWETACPPLPEVLDFHLRRIKRAQQVCTALIADQASDIAYCESLLVLAFFMTLPQACAESKVGDDSSFAYIDDSSAFWLLRTLIGKVFHDYYAKPRRAESEYGGSTQEALCVKSGAMDDIFLLECCLAYYMPDLWLFLHRIGFQLATVFYGAFMRLFATYMPTATVFRFWDILFAYSPEAHALAPTRAYLIDLAFAVLRSLKDDILQCESAFDVKTCILGSFGAIYDMSSVVDITLHAHKYLWGGSGFNATKVMHLFNERETLFRNVNQTLTEQNQVLKVMTHETSINPQPSSAQRGSTTKDIAKFFPQVSGYFESTPPMEDAGVDEKTGKPLPGKPLPNPGFWAMHRPMPLVAHYLCETTIERTVHHVKELLRIKREVDPIPRAIGPPKLGSGLEARSKLVYPGTDPFGFNEGTFREVFGRIVPSWGSFSDSLWQRFNCRTDYYASEEMRDRKNNDPYNLYGRRDWSNLWGLITDDNEGYIKTQMQATMLLPQQEQIPKISMNELFVSLIVCSQGTLASKANHLFNIHSYVSPFYNANNPPLHRQPVAKMAKSLAGVQEAAVDARALSAPEPDEEKDNALHFTVYSNYPSRGTLIGDVYIPSLGPYITVNYKYAESQSYNIWGPKPDAVQTHLENQKKSNNKTNSKDNIGKADVKDSKPGDLTITKTGSMQDVDGRSSIHSVAAKDKVCLGELEVSICWMPGSLNEPSKGQLVVQVKAIRFYTLYVLDGSRKNPYVYLKTYKRGSKGDVSEKSISRWDPERRFHFLDKMTELYWASPMGEGWFGHAGEHLKQKRDDQGWVMNKNVGGGEWVWSEQLGKQFSTKDYDIDERYLNLEKRKNVMDMAGVRNIVTTILNRSMMSLSNRQQILIADSAFNRGGAVPGILEAILVRATDCAVKPTAPTGGFIDCSKEDVVSLYEMKQAWNGEPETSKGKSSGPARKKVSYHDFSNEVGIEHERQIRITGVLNLFSPLYFEYFKNGINLKDMGIKDPFPFMEKVLWIRYVRGGDGERCTQGVNFDRSGKLQHDPQPEIMMDLVDCWPQTKITKEEFISCLINSPVLGESIRRIGSADHVMQPRKSISLDVEIMDPHHMEIDNMFQDAINVQQSILLELWDADVVSKDFLGECWLPPLQELSSQEKDYMLPVKPADFNAEAERGPSREPEGKFTASKNVDQKVADKDKRIGGNLLVKLAWVYPAYEFNEETGECRAKGEDEEPDDKKKKPDVSLNERADIQEKLHTGKLTIKIIKANGLRRSDAGRFSSRDCDPQVHAWRRNDVTKEWEEKAFARSSVVKNNRNPSWKNEFPEPFEILSGDFEARFKEEEDGIIDKIKDVFKSSRTKREEEEDEDMKKVNRFGTGGLKLKFVEKESPLEGGPNAKQSIEPESKKKDDKKEKESESDGSHHQVEVFLNDSIREFKAKCTQACLQEMEYWNKQGAASAEKMNKYKDVKIGFKHLVMAFVPTAKVTQMVAQKKTDSREYAHAYKIAFDDPSNWQPLDPARSFQQYPQFAFGRPTGQRLKVVEATESYRLVNVRYKEFEKEQNRPSYVDMNTQKRCYGYAKYVLNSERGRERNFEWKPAFISNDGPEDGEEEETKTKGAESKTKSRKGKPKYKIEWVLKPHVAADTTAQKGNAEGMELARFDTIEKDNVMFVPRCALINDNFAEEHREVLTNAKELRKMGKSDFDIEKVLNDMLMETYGKDKDKPKPPRITVDIIRSYILFTDARAAAKEGSADAPFDSRASFGT